MDDKGDEQLSDELLKSLREVPWVKEADIRLREHGHVFFGEIFIIPRDEADPLARTRQVVELAHASDWRLHDVTVQLVDRFD